MSWQITEKEGVAVVQMNSNDVNKMNLSFFDDVEEAFDRLDAEYPNLPAVLSGHGYVFSTGLDFEDTHAISQRGNSDEIYAWFGRYCSALVRAFAFPRPLVAAVNGHAVTGGLILALCCDVRVAAEGNFKYGRNPVGIPMARVSTEIMRLRVGSAAADAMHGKLYSQAESARLGFLNEVVPPECLMQVALQRARAGAGEHLEAYVHSKEMLIRPTMHQIQKLISEPS